MSTEPKPEPIELLKARPVPHPGRVIGGIIVALIAITVIHSLITNPKYDWPTVQKWLFAPSIVRGVMYTLLLTVCAMLIGIVLALLAAVGRKSTNPVNRAVAGFYIWFFRGTPIYTQLIFWGVLPSLYSQVSIGLPIGPQYVLGNTQEIFTPLVCALLGLGLNEGAYLAEIFRSGFAAVDPGQAEAAKALGMSPRQIQWRIVAPQAMRVIVPPTGNETISMLKTTSLVIAIPVTNELTFQATRIGQKYYTVIPMLIVAALWYLFITSVLMVGQHYLEAYYGRGSATGSGKAVPKRQLSKKQAAILAAHTVTDDPFLEFTP
ncbi:ABC transporter permease [Boudabousia liubingyangii]|uniref:ABC transporter permease n=1 Tax=Boudabousia liubingyangii TaxID=1921764 RepID=A0A1Q5PNA0_9ACTO|nr:amino acid ABC transporter permease [Boudabousia liubingyangii]OKL49021.1 ABC transporter permease [Boudabousia liubingyangii]